MLFLYRYRRRQGFDSALIYESATPPPLKTDKQADIWSRDGWEKVIVCCKNDIKIRLYGG